MIPGKPFFGEMIMGNMLYQKALQKNVLLHWVPYKFKTPSAAVSKTDALFGCILILYNCDLLWSYSIAAYCNIILGRVSSLGIAVDFFCFTRLDYSLIVDRGRIWVMSSVAVIRPENFPCRLPGRSSESSQRGQGSDTCGGLRSLVTTVVGSWSKDVKSM